MGSKTHPFIIDKNKNLYEIYLKSESVDGENRYYKKKVITKEVVEYLYDE